MFLNINNITVLVFAPAFSDQLDGFIHIMIFHLFKLIEVMMLLIFILVVPILCVAFVTQTIFHKNIRVLFINLFILVTIQSVVRLIMIPPEYGIIHIDGKFVEVAC